MSATSAEAFWSANQPGFRFTTEQPGTPEFFAAVERHRYALEPHVLEMLEPERWAGRDVLEVGCGIGTDGAQLARAGACYTGLDLASAAVELAQRRFDLEGLEGRFVHGSATELPFPAESFDLVYSHGVLHHFEDTERAVDELYRVLRRGGTALVMLYHRGSLNYHLTIMVVRRVLAAALLLPRAVPAIARITGEDRRVLEAHRALLREHGVRYLSDRARFLSANTDGPWNPLSKAFSRREAAHLFARFACVETTVRFLNLRLYPGGERLARTAAARRLERGAGWHLYVRAEK